MRNFLALILFVGSVSLSGQTARCRGPERTGVICWNYDYFQHSREQNLAEQGVNNTNTPLFKDNTSEDIRFTVNGDMLYAIVPDIPESQRLTIRSLVEANGFDASRIQHVSLLGSEEEVKWKAVEGGLELEFGDAGALQHAMSFAIKLQ